MGRLVEIIGMLIIVGGAIATLFGLSGSGSFELLLLRAIMVGGPWILGGILIAAFGQMLIEIKATRLAAEKQLAILSGAKL